MLNLLKYVAANPYNISAKDINVPKTTGTITEGITNITTLAMSVLGSLAVIFIIVGGILMAISAGDPKRFARGRETVLYACVGLAVAISALAIVTFVANSVKGGH